MCMNLSVTLVGAEAYRAAAHSLPFIYRVTFEHPTVVVGSIEATACLLVHREDNEISTGYARNIFSISEIERFHEAGTCTSIEVNALANEPELANLIAGEYELSAKVSLRVKEFDGAIRHKELRATRQVLLA